MNDSGEGVAPKDEAAAGKPPEPGPTGDGTLRAAERAAPASAPYAPPAIPPPVWPGGAPESVASPPPRRPKAAVLAGLGVIAAVVVGIGLKFVLPLVIGGVIGGAFTGAFGGPWERLPSDVKAGYEQRLEAAVGNRLEGLSETEQAAKIQSWLYGGLVRLDDTKLIRHLELEVQALRLADEPTCAAFGRQSMTGQTTSEDTGEKLIGTLDQAAIGEWVGLSVEAIESELRGSPEAIRVSEADSAAATGRLIGGLNPAELETFAAMDSGRTVSDGDTCAAIRSLYNGILLLDPQDKATMARVDIQP
jgi:hypothetical protein